MIKSGKMFYIKVANKKSENIISNKKWEKIFNVIKKKAKHLMSQK